MAKNLFSLLNDRQREACMATEGPVLIVAGAGTGKTMALMYRIAYLITEKHINPANILAVTFTNKAAGEMKERIAKLVKADSPLIGTFHAICVQILRREIQHLGYENNFVIYDSDDSLALIKRVMKHLQIAEKNFNPRSVQHFISAAKNVLQTADQVQMSATNFFQKKAGMVYAAYQQELKKQQALDFDDLLMKTVELFQQFPAILQKYQHRWKYFHVDEYQDTNSAQYHFVRLLAQKHKNLCVVGDPDQNIYSWRGADMTNILNFTKDYSKAKVIKLEQNYRSTPHILKAAETVISENKNRIKKSLWTGKKKGKKVQMVDTDDERAEAEWVIHNATRFLGNLRDHVVLYRTNAQSRVLEETCLRAGIPYRVIGGVKFYARKEIKDMVAYLRLIQNPFDDTSFLRIINTPSRHIGAKTVESLQHTARRSKQSLLESIAETDKDVLKEFQKLISELEKFSREFPTSTLIREILHRTKYDKMLLEEKEVGETRLENVRELISVAKKYDELEHGIGLATFLEEVALVSDIDELQGSEDYLTLMTVHSAKGLEFEHVYVVGLEEGIFPHSRSAFDPQQMEEERRLMYVAMTRAKEHLYLVWARRRLLFGETQYNPPSSFLSAIPQDTAEGEYFAQAGEESTVKSLRERIQNEPVVFLDEMPKFMRNFRAKH